MKQSNTKYVNQTKTEIPKYPNFESNDVRASFRDNPSDWEAPRTGNL